MSTEKSWEEIAETIDRDASDAMASGFYPDLNPIRGADGKFYCGPTSGRWIEANGLEEIETRWTPARWPVTVARINEA